MDIKVFLRILSYDIDTVSLFRSEPHVKAGVRIDLKIEVVWRVGDFEEEFKTAVFVHRRKRRGILGANVFLCRTEMDIETVV